MLESMQVSEPIANDNGGIRITLGFAAQIAVTILSIGIAWASVKAELATAVAQAADDAAQIRTLQVELIDTRLEVRSMGARIDILMQSYERDANKYIRDPKDRR